MHTNPSKLDTSVAKQAAQNVEGDVTRPDEKIIGVVAGVGPFAGLDLLQKILEQTLAGKDQDHLTVVSLSQPRQILDRTEYLLGQVETNPAYAMVDQLSRLEKIGASVAGISCNTAHAPAIFDTILAGLRAANSQIKLLHMIAEVARHLRENHSQIKRVGVLSSTGTYRTRIYPQVLEPAGFTVILPNPSLQEQVIHLTVYDPDYGIKACGRVTEAAREGLLKGVDYLQQEGAEAIILGCTEIALAIKENKINEMAIVDPTVVLARALIREANPTKLMPLPL
jgi:aspartate racemase